MTNYQEREVYKYLTHLEYYLNGDLNTFHKVCKEVDLFEENTPIGAITASNSGNTSIIEEAASLSTTTQQTTRFPSDIPVIQSKIYFDNKNNFRLTIPIALSLFSTIDCVGNLLSKVDKPINNDLKSCLSYFIENSTIKLTDEEKILLIDVFRNGLSHVYFPKLSLGISYHNSNPTENLFFKDKSGILILNVNRLELIVVETLKIIKENANLHSHMENRYQKLKSKYKDQYDDIITKFIH